MRRSLLPFLLALLFGVFAVLTIQAVRMSRHALPYAAQVRQSDGGGSCQLNGRACQKGLDCCSGNCVGGLCEARSCLDAGMPCTPGGDECCYHTCPADGICRPEYECVGEGASCDGGESCCTGLTCVENIQEGATCERVACSANGSACTDGRGCCSGYCNASGACAPVPSCAPDGDRCAESASCCSGNCVDFQCVPPPPFTMEITDGKDAVQAGEAISYTITATRHPISGRAIDTVTIEARLPSEITAFVEDCEPKRGEDYGSVRASDGGKVDCRSGIVRWTGTGVRISLGESIRLGIQVKAMPELPGPATLLATAQVLGWASATDTTEYGVLAPPPAPAFNVIVTGSPRELGRDETSPPTRGDTSLVSVIVQNTSRQVRASSVQVTLDLQAPLVPILDEDSDPPSPSDDGEIAGGTVRWTVPFLTADTNKTLTVRVMLDARSALPAPNTRLNARASVPGKSDTAIITANPVADPTTGCIEIRKVASTPFGGLFPNFTFTATRGLLTGIIGSSPGGTTGGGGDGGTGGGQTQSRAERVSADRWIITGLVPGDYFVGELPIPGWQPENPSGQVGPIPVRAGAACATVTFRNRQLPSASALTIIHAGNPPLVKPEQTVGFTVTVTNAGGPISNAQLIVPLPALLLEYLPGSAVAGAAYNAQARTLTWTNVSLDANKALTFGYKAKVPATLLPGTAITVVATLMTPSAGLLRAPTIVTVGGNVGCIELTKKVMNPLAGAGAAARFLNPQLRPPPTTFGFTLVRPTREQQEFTITAHPLMGPFTEEEEEELEGVLARGVHTIRNLPPGEYTIREAMRNDYRHEGEQKVRVAAGGECVSLEFTNTPVVGQPSFTIGITDGRTMTSPRDILEQTITVKNVSRVPATNVEILAFEVSEQGRFLTYIPGVCYNAPDNDLSCEEEGGMWIPGPGGDTQCCYAGPGGEHVTYGDAGAWMVKKTFPLLLPGSTAGFSFKTRVVPVAAPGSIILMQARISGHAPSPNDVTKIFPAPARLSCLKITLAALDQNGKAVPPPQFSFTLDADREPRVKNIGKLVLFDPVPPGFHTVIPTPPAHPSGYWRLVRSQMSPSIPLPFPAPFSVVVPPDRCGVLDMVWQLFAHSPSSAPGGSAAGSSSSSASEEEEEPEVEACTCDQIRCPLEQSTCFGDCDGGCNGECNDLYDRCVASGGEEECVDAYEACAAECDSWEECPDTCAAEADDVCPAAEGTPDLWCDERLWSPPEAFLPDYSSGNPSHDLSGGAVFFRPEYRSGLEPASLNPHDDPQAENGLPLCDDTKTLGECWIPGKGCFEMTLFECPRGLMFFPYTGSLRCDPECEEGWCG